MLNYTPLGHHIFCSNKLHIVDVHESPCGVQKDFGRKYSSFFNKSIVGETRNMYYIVYFVIRRQSTMIAMDFYVLWVKVLWCIDVPPNNVFNIITIFSQELMIQMHKREEQSHFLKRYKQLYRQAGGSVSLGLTFLGSPSKTGNNEAEVTTRVDYILLYFPVGKLSNVERRDRLNCVI
jgi:hypothetical protein